MNGWIDVKRCLAAFVLIAAPGMAVGCGTKGDDAQEQVKDAAAIEEDIDMQARAREFLDSYQKEFDKCWCEWTATEWDAAISGKKEDFDAHAEAELALSRLHSDPSGLEEINGFLEKKDLLEPLDARALEVARCKFQEQQLPGDMIKGMADMSAKIGQAFNTFRGEFEGSKCSNNELLDVLAKDKNGSRRKAAWEALKQVGGAVSGDLIALAKVRNEGANKVGFENYWEMKIRLQEYDPAVLMKTFDELEQLTLDPFRKMKSKLDSELANSFGIDSNEIMPWHYNNPFFQAAPPSAAIDMDEFYRGKSREEIRDIAIRFYDDIGLPIKEIVSRSDLFEKEGKDQHAFCEDMDRKGDVRILVNLRPTAEWMDTMLHECGHAVYDEYIDGSLPFNLRAANHMFTTEAVAMLFGALAKNPAWIVEYAGANEERVSEMSEAILEQRRREQLIFCRWTLVMLHFEKALYENPEQDLNRLWWELKARFQLLKKPEGRDLPDWAAKPHFTIAPVYYHNYQLGELFAAQLRTTLAKIADHQGPPSSLSFNGRKDFGSFLKEKVFNEGKSVPWSEFVKEATGEKLTAEHFASEL